MNSEESQIEGIECLSNITINIFRYIPCKVTVEG